MTENIIIKIDSKYHRTQFDDYLAGGKVEHKKKIYYWSAQNNNYNFGWEIEPVDEKDWDDLSEEESNEIISLIEEYLYIHKTEYEVTSKLI